jgi:cytochrome c oxidase assembly factor CtaG
MNLIERAITAFAALALAAIGVLVALGTLPSRVEAEESGRLIPWMLCWALAWIAAFSAVAVAGFLLAPPRRTR